MASTKRRTGRSTTWPMAKLIRSAITSTEAAVRAKAHARVRAAAWSARSSEKRAAAAPAGMPARVIGAITSQ